MRKFYFFSYFCSVKKKLPTYDEARKALRDKGDAQSYLHLGILYSKGMGIGENHALANYFYNKALAMGCQEAEAYIDKEYESGNRKAEDELRLALEDIDHVGPLRLRRLKKIVEKARVNHNEGILALIRNHFNVFYPQYSQENAIDDILENRNSVDADLFASLCSAENKAEMDIQAVDKFLQLVYSPIEGDEGLRQCIKGKEEDLLSKDEQELLMCYSNFMESYDTVCNKYPVNRKELSPVESLELFPYLSLQTLRQLRRQSLRCLLSAKELDPIITDEFLNHLDNTTMLLGICEKIEDQDLQFFVIEFVEMNVDIKIIEEAQQGHMNAYKNKISLGLADLAVQYAERLENAGIDYQLVYLRPD